MHETDVNLFSVPWTQKGLPLYLNSVLEDVCEQLSSTLANVTQS